MTDAILLHPAVEPKTTSLGITQHLIPFALRYRRASRVTTKVNTAGGCPSLMPFALRYRRVSVPNIKTKFNVAGGCPAASHFFLLRQRKSNQKEGGPGLPPLRGTLDLPQASGAAQLDLAGRTLRAPLRDSNKTCWLRHNLKVSLRRNKPPRGVLSPKPPLPCS